MTSIFACPLAVLICFQTHPFFKPNRKYDRMIQDHAQNPVMIQKRIGTESRNRTEPAGLLIQPQTGKYKNYNYYE